MSLNITKACDDPNLFRPFLADKGGSVDSWQNWRAALRVLYGHTIAPSRNPVVQQCTGRDPDNLPDGGFSTALFLTGRRSGKSRTAAIIGAFEAVLAGHEKKLARGERGVVAVCAPSKAQGRIVKDYLRAIFTPPLLAAEVARETAEGFELNNGTRIEILAGDFKTVRGFTLLAAIVDEAAFFGFDADSKVRSDTELIRAIKPSLATVGGKLIAITSPYAKKGWTYRTHQKNYGNEAGSVLVWNCPSRTMNPLLPQSVVDEALAEDLQAAKSEYLGEFRDDVGEFLPRNVIEALVVPERTQLPPRAGVRYVAFADVSGGRGDDAAFAIAHREKRVVVLDLICRYRPPFSPYEIVQKMGAEARRYGVRKVVGDNYAAEFCAGAFTAAGLRYERCLKPKAALYLELLPLLCAGEVELPDDEALVNQLAGLERRTRAGGKDIIDHAPGQHDDLSNVCAGAAVAATTTPLVVGGAW